MSIAPRLEDFRLKKGGQVCIQTEYLGLRGMLEKGHILPREGKEKGAHLSFFQKKNVSQRGSCKGKEQVTYAPTGKKETRCVFSEACNRDA